MQKLPDYKFAYQDPNPKLLLHWLSLKTNQLRARLIILELISMLLVQLRGNKMESTSVKHEELKAESRVEIKITKQRSEDNYKWGKGWYAI